MTREGKAGRTVIYQHSGDTSYAEGFADGQNELQPRIAALVAALREFVDIFGSKSEGGAIALADAMKHARAALKAAGDQS